MSLRPAPAGSALRGEGIALALFGVFLVASLFAWVHPWYEQLPDASLYITTARALAAGEGYTYLGVPFHARPPGFSALLAPVIAAAGTDFRILNLFVAAWGLVAVLLLYRLERERLGWPLALLVAGALWLNPGFRRLSCQVMSDVPALALLLACLLVERWASRADAPRRELVLGLAVGLAAYVRSSLILLVPAILAARVAVRWSGERPRERARSFILRRAALFPLVAVLVLLPWSIRDAVRAPPPPADQTYLYAHFTGVLHKDPGDPASRRLSVGEIFSRAQMRARQVGAVLGSRMRSWVRGKQLDDGPAAVPTAVALALIASATVAALRRRSADGFFVLASVVSILLYYGFQYRLFLPVYALALPMLVEVMRDMGARLAGARAGAAIAVTLVAAVIAVDFGPRPEWDAIEAEHHRFELRCRALADQLPRDGRVATAVGFHYTVCLERPVWSLRFAVRRAKDAEAAEAIIDRYGLTAVFLSPEMPDERELLPYFHARYGNPATAGASLVFPVRPTDPGQGG